MNRTIQNIETIIDSQSDDEDDDDKRTLFVANLDDRISEELLYETFMQAGPVDSVRIPRDNTGRQRSFGFVTYSHKCSVEYAIKLLTGLSLFRKNIVIKLQEEPSQKRRSYPTDKELHVNNNQTGRNTADDNRQRGAGGKPNDNNERFNPFKKQETSAPTNKFTEQSLPNRNTESGGSRMNCKDVNPFKNREKRQECDDINPFKSQSGNRNDFHEVNPFRSRGGSSSECSESNPFKSPPGDFSPLRKQFSPAGHNDQTLIGRTGGGGGDRSSWNANRGNHNMNNFSKNFKRKSFDTSPYSRGDNNSKHSGSMDRDHHDHSNFKKNHRFNHNKGNQRSKQRNSKKRL